MSGRGRKGALKVGQPDAEVSDGNHHLPDWTQRLGAVPESWTTRTCSSCPPAPHAGSALAYLQVTQGTGHILLLPLVPSPGDLLPTTLSPPFQIHLNPGEQFSPSSLCWSWGSLTFICSGPEPLVVCPFSG